MVRTDFVTIIPAKAVSQRVQRKNFREFYDGRCLVEITLAKLLAAGLPAERIYLSCEDPRTRGLADRLGIRFLLRDPRFVSNDAFRADVIRGVCAQVPGDDDVVWAQVINPLFDEYDECLSLWERERDAGYDSLSVRHAFRDYLLGPDGWPIGWGWGPWHRPSQRLPELFRFTFSLSILTRDCIDRVGYDCGARPLWYTSRQEAVDIDTLEQFRDAQAIYAQRQRTAARNAAR